MNRIYLSLVLTLVVLVVCAGCVSSEVKEALHVQRVTVETYIEQAMTKDLTTQEQDQAVLMECYKTLLLLDWELSDDEDAEARWKKFEEGKPTEDSTE